MHGCGVHRSASASDGGGDTYPLLVLFLYNIADSFFPLLSLSQSHFSLLHSALSLALTELSARLPTRNMQ